MCLKNSSWLSIRSQKQHSKYFPSHVILQCLLQLALPLWNQHFNRWIKCFQPQSLKFHSVFSTNIMLTTIVIVLPSYQWVFNKGVYVWVHGMIILFWYWIGYEEQCNSTVYCDQLLNVWQHDICSMNMPGKITLFKFGSLIIIIVLWMFWGTSQFLKGKSFKNGLILQGVGPVVELASALCRTRFSPSVLS